MAHASSCPAPEVLEQLVLGQIPESESAAFLEHLTHCPRCGERLRALLAEETLVSAMRAAPQAQAALPQGELIQGMIERLCQMTQILPAGLTTRGEGLGDLPAVVGRYRLESEIARGGMGRIVRVREEDFDRALAMKVLLRQGGGLEERLLREARLTGLLQHPGIPPVHALGRLDDGRPYFVMKLIQGRSLQELLRERSSPAADLPRFLGIFEHICQTVGYAHARGVLHRDLKPGNIMVGAFGEVQVMDWGLAKVFGLPAGLEEGTPAPDGTVSGLRRSATLAETTLAESVLGTPAYMAPEQARGEVGSLDARADVFGLGAILCDILTGGPPFQKETARELVRQAAAGDLSEALSRLAGCGVDDELTGLARRCLAARREERPADGAAVAGAVAAYRAELERRLRQAEIDRAAADARAAEEHKLRAAEQARAAEERKRRRLALSLTATLALLLAGGSLAALWYQADQRRQETERALRQEYLYKEVDTALREAAQKRAALRGQLQTPQQVHELLSDIDQWQTRLQGARAAWRRAQTLAEPDRELLKEERAARLRDLEQGLAADDKDLALARELEAIRLEASGLVAGKWDYRRAAQKYPKVFARAGLDLEHRPPAALAGRITRTGVRYALVAALDHWADVTPDQKLRARLLEAARRADPQAWRDRFRQEKVWNDLKELERLAKELRPQEQSPQVMIALAFRLKKKGRQPAALLRRALLHHARDFWLYFYLGTFVNDPVERMGCFQAALAVRPRSGPAHINLGVALVRNKDLAGGITHFRTAILLDPKDAKAHYNLGSALYFKEDLTRAITHFRMAILLDPGYAMAHNNLGHVLYVKKILVGAIRHFRKAIELDANNAPAHINLGNVLYDQKDPQGAISHYRKAIRIAPRLAPAHYNLGNVLYETKDLQGAISHYRKAIQFAPHHVGAHHNLGLALRETKDFEGAGAQFRQAIQLDPDFISAYGALAHTLLLQGKLAESRRATQQCLERLPVGHPLRPLVHLLLRGRFGEARQAARHCLERLPGDDPLRPLVQQHVQHCDALLALEGQLANFLAKGETPKDVQKQLALAMVCRLYKHYHAAAVRLYAGAFAAQPTLASDLARPHRYRAACSAVLAAAGQGREPNQPGAQEQVQLRARARAWLQADLALFARQSQAGRVETVLLALDKLPIWDEEPELASVRAPQALAGLPAAEQESWRKFWTEADQLLKEIRSRITQITLKGTLTAKERVGTHDMKLAAGTSYVIELYSTAGKASLKVLNGKGDLLTEKGYVTPQNAGPRLIFTPTEAGRFRIVVGSFQEGDRDAYLVTIRAFGKQRK